MGPGVIAGAAAGYLLNQPFAKQFLADVDFVLGINETSRARYNFYRENYAATLYPRDVTRTPIRQGFDQLLTGFNQAPWPSIDNDPDTQRLIWETFRNNCRRMAIDVSNDALPGPETTPTLQGEFEALQWRRLIDMSAAAAPLGNVIRDYWRSNNWTGPGRPVDRDELHFNLQRAQLRRKQDRDRFLSPFLAWSPQDAIRLRWLGVIDDAELENLLRAASVGQHVDRDWIEIMSRVVPDIDTLQGWSVRGLWDQGFADRYGLDAGADASPVAKFFMRAQGSRGAAPALPGQPDGNADWTALAFRAARPLPDFGLAMQLQWRLRRSPADSSKSVVGGVPPWDASNTRDMLRVAGYTEPVIERMMGLTTQPLNVRILNNVLLQALKHASVRDAATEAFGPGNDWVKGVYLDHGFSDPIAELAARGIEAHADDEANAERLEHEKRLRQANRDSFLLQYKLGLADATTTRNGMIDPFYTGEMADHEIAIVKAELDLGVKKAGIAALREAWISGKMPASDIAQSLTGLGVTEEAKDRYLGEWIWERTEKTRMLSTGEILAALKDGLMSAPIAGARLVNLGWSAADALIEVAQAQNSISQAQAKTAAAAATKAAAEAAKHHAQQIAAEKAEQKAAAAEAAKIHKETLAAEKAASSEAAKEAKENAKITDQEQLATHQQLLATDKYYAAIHAANSAYATAESKGDTEKMQEETAKELGDYEKYLIAKLKLLQEGQGVESVIGTAIIPESPVSKPSAGANASAPAAGTATPNAGGSPGGAGQ